MLFFILLNLLFIIYIMVYPFIEIAKGKLIHSHNNFIPENLTFPISIIISIYNEERYIQAKIEEILSENIWIKGSELIIVSSGSTDKTNEILQRYEDDSRIRIVIIKEHLLKIENVNLAVEMANNNYLVFSDCRQKMEKGSILILINALITQNIGVAAGTLINLKNEKTDQSFRNCLNRMNIAKGKKGCSMNIYGALYALHRSTFRPIPTNILFDDLYVLTSTLAQKKRVIQIPNAIIYEVNFDTYYQEERIQRLTRGLLIFWVTHFNLIFKIPIKTLFHFLMSKYAKLLIPYLTIQLVVLFLFYIYQNHILFVISLILLFLTPLFYKQIPFLKLSIRLIYYTLKAEYLFYMKNQRSIRWEKLKH